LRKILAAIIVGVLLLSMFSIFATQLRAQGINLISNGGFEAGLNGWNHGVSGSPIWGVTSENVHGGDESFKISSTLSEAVYLWQLLSFPSSSYRFSAWVYRIGSDSSTIIELLKKDPWLAGRGWAPVCSAIYIMNDMIGVEAWDYIGGSGWEYHKNIKWLDISLAPNQWHEISFVTDGEPKTQSVYLDSILITELTTNDSWAPELLILGDVASGDFAGTFYFDDAQLSEPEQPPLAVVATIDIDPDMSNLRSRGRWITAYIQLPEIFDAADINASTLMLNGTISPVLDPKYGFVTNSSEYLVDHNNDEIVERMIKFERAAITSWIYQSIGMQHDVSLTITGELNDGTLLVGSVTILVLWQGQKAPFKR